jgi:predicted DNA-binding transcriptional regulator AlpA
LKAATRRHKTIYGGLKVRLPSRSDRSGAELTRVAESPAPAFYEDTDDDEGPKDYQRKGGLCWSSRQLGNVNQACKMLGYSRDSFYRFKELSTKTLPRKTSAKRPSGSKASTAQTGGGSRKRGLICVSICPQRLSIQGSGNEVGKPFPWSFRISGYRRD